MRYLAQSLSNTFGVRVGYQRSNGRRAVVKPVRTCPECGNDDRSTFEHNGRRPDSFDFSLLCTQCGTQWEPNAD